MITPKGCTCRSSRGSSLKSIYSVFAGDFDLRVQAQKTTTHHNTTRYTTQQYACNALHTQMYTCICIYIYNNILWRIFFGKLICLYTVHALPDYCRSTTSRAGRAESPGSRLFVFFTRGRHVYGAPRLVCYPSDVSSFVLTRKNKPSLCPACLDIVCSRRKTRLTRHPPPETAHDSKSQICLASENVECYENYARVRHV